MEDVLVSKNVFKIWKAYLDNVAFSIFKKSGKCKRKVQKTRNYSFLNLSNQLE